MLNLARVEENTFGKSKLSLAKSNLFYILTCLTLFSTTFEGRYITLGAQLTADKVISLISMTCALGLFIGIVKNKAFDSLRYKKLILSTITFLLFVTAISNLIFLAEPVNPDAAVYYEDLFGSDDLAIFRTALKPVQAFVLLLSQLSWILIPSLAFKKNIQIVQAAWVYVASSTFQAVLGLLQYIIHFATGINIFPVYRGGVFDGNLYHQNAVFSFGGRLLLRINALAGEPKQLSLHLSFALAILVFLLIRSHSIRARYIAYICIILNFIALILTFSTVGFAFLISGGLIFINTRKNKLRSLVLVIAGLFLAVSFIQIPSTVSELFEVRVLERLGIEDFDMIYIEFIKSSPLNLILGCGIGNFHLASFNQALEILNTYYGRNFGIFMPYLGVLNLMAISGIVGTLSFYLLPYKLISKLSRLLRLVIPSERDFYLSMRNLLLVLIFIGLVLRFHMLGFMWLGIGFATLENLEKSILSRNTFES